MTTYFRFPNRKKILDYDDYIQLLANKTWWRSEVRDRGCAEVLWWTRSDLTDEGKGYCFRPPIAIGRLMTCILSHKPSQTDSSSLTATVKTKLEFRSMSLG